MKNSLNQEQFSSRQTIAPASAEHLHYARTRQSENTQEVKTIAHSGSIQEPSSQQLPSLNNAQLDHAAVFQGQQQYSTAEQQASSRQNFNERFTTSLRGSSSIQDDLDEPLSVAPQL